MAEKVHQSHSSFLKAAGFVIVPLLMAVPFFPCSMIRYNYTGLLNNLSYRPLFTVCTAPCLLFYGISLVKAGHTAGLHRLWNRCCILLAALTLTCLAIPYHSKEDFLSGLHVFVGFAAFVFLNAMLLKLLWMNRKLLFLYAAGLVPAWFTALTFASVNGLSEWIYSTLLSITLTLLNTQA